MWEHHHYRFGLAGEGQADIIQRYLETHYGNASYVGCGPLIERLQNVSSYCSWLIGVDKNQRCIDLIRTKATHAGINLSGMDAKELALKSESIDSVLAIGLFAEVREPESVFREFYRVCRPGGHAIVTNSVAHPLRLFVRIGVRSGFRLIQRETGYCPAA